MPIRQVSREAVVASVRRACAGGKRPSIDELAAQAGVSRARLYRMFPGPGAIFEAAGVDPAPQTVDRILSAAAELLARDGLAALAMDEVADRAGVSRATLYRLFPGKPALFRELIRVYSPMEGIAELLDEMGDRPPVEVVPALARLAARTGYERLGLLRSVFFEVTGGAADADQGKEYYLERGVQAIVRYITEQMAAGRLRPMHPVLAIQGFAGPVIFHLLTRSLAEDRLGFDVPVDDAVDELAQMWLRAMTLPDPRGT